MKLNSTSGLTSYFENNEVLSFESSIQKMSRWKIFLFSLAGRDFNPMHCKEGFEEYSIFKSITSQGIGVIARAEGEFVKEFQFIEATEIIASGIDNIRYHKPLLVNSKHKYIFELRKIKSSSKYDKYICTIKCVFSDDKSLITSWDWNISFIPVKNPPTEKIVVKSYFYNVVDFLIFRSFEKIFRFVLLLCILYMIIRPFTDLAGFTEADPTLYEGMCNL